MMMKRDKRINGDYNLIDRSSKSPLAMPSSSPASPSPPSTVVGVGASCIEHPVSKFDTLAGVAIKYGVEVADIKRMNGLVTDLQMFALKTLQIPLPGRHPPSPILINGHDSQGPSSSEQAPPNRRHSDFFDSFQSLKLKSSPNRDVSPAMSTLQGYYGLKPAKNKSPSEGVEMSVYRKGSSHYLEDGPFPKFPPLSNTPLSHHRKSKSLANGFLSENGDAPDNDNDNENRPIAESRETDSDKWMEKLVRRRQKSVTDFGTHTPETMLEDNNNGGSGGGFSAMKGKGLALRPKAGGRTSNIPLPESEGQQNSFPVNLMDSGFSADGLNVVRKSSSTSCLQDSESGSSSSTSSSYIWPTSKWSLKPDLQAFSAANITRPIFDGLPNPITGRRNKTALD